MTRVWVWFIFFEDRDGKYPEDEKEKDEIIEHAKLMDSKIFGLEYKKTNWWDKTKKFNFELHVNDESVGLLSFKFINGILGRINYPKLDKIGFWKFETNK